MKIAGRIVSEHGVSFATLSFDTEIISIDNSCSDDPDVIAYNDNCIIYPGFIDLHANCLFGETYDTIKCAALNGGVTYLCNMPTDPPLLDKIDVLQYSLIGPFGDPLPLDVPYVVDIGVELSVMCPDDIAHLDRMLECYKGNNVSFRISMCGVTNGRAVLLEIKAIETAIELIEKHKLRGKICQISTVSGIERVIKAKADGVNVTAEVAPHHLYFDLSMINAVNENFLRTDPPLRRYDNKVGLLDHLKHGDIDFLVSTHTPRERSQSVPGLPHLDTYGLFVLYLLSKGVDPAVLYKMCCSGPGDWVRQFVDRKIGRITVGYEASFVVLDTKTTEMRRPLYSKCMWSPFDIRSLPGNVKAVYVRGKNVVDGLWVDN